MESTSRHLKPETMNLSFSVFYLVLVDHMELEGSFRMIHLLCAPGSDYILAWFISWKIVLQRCTLGGGCVKFPEKKRYVTHEWPPMVYGQTFIV